MRARYWFVALVAAVVLLPATEAAAHTRHRRQVAAFMGPVSVAKAAGVRIVHAKRTAGLRAKAATLTPVTQDGAGFNCGVFVGTATGGHPDVAYTTNSTDDLELDSNPNNLYGFDEVSYCSGTLPTGSTTPFFPVVLNYSNCYTEYEATALPGAYQGPGTGSVMVDPNGKYSASCAAPFDPYL